MGTMTVKFNQGAFKKGVNDALTLAPLREAIRVAKSGQLSGKDVVSRSSNPDRGVDRGNPASNKRR